MMLFEAQPPVCTLAMIPTYRCAVKVEYVAVLLCLGSPYTMRA